MIYQTTVQNGNLEYNWAIKPTSLWTNRFSVDRVHEPGINNHYPTLSDLGLPAILNQNSGLAGIPPSTWETLSSPCLPSVAWTPLLHTPLQLLVVAQWVKGPHSITSAASSGNYLTTSFSRTIPREFSNFTRDVTTQDPNGGLGDNNQGNPFATMLVGFPFAGRFPTAHHSVGSG